MTFVELLLVIVLIAIFAAPLLTIMTVSADETNAAITLRVMEAIRNALVGSPHNVDSIEDSNRASFLRDIGRLPTQDEGLAALNVQPAGIANWQTTSVGINMGYRNGGYIPQDILDLGYLNDGWGNPFIYTVSGAAPGQSATVTSYGADGVAGGTGVDADLTVSISATDTAATVEGTIYIGTTPIDTAITPVEVKIYYPDGSGNITSTSVTTATNGTYSIQNVPKSAFALSAATPNLTSPTLAAGPLVVWLKDSVEQVNINLADLNSPTHPTADPTKVTSPLCFTSTTGTQTSSSPFLLSSGSNLLDGSNQLNFTSVDLQGNRELLIDIAKETPQAINYVTVGSTTFNCSGTTTMSPCPAFTGSILSLVGGTLPVGAQNIAVQLALGNTFTLNYARMMVMTATLATGACP